MRVLVWYWGRRGGGADFTVGVIRLLANQFEVDVVVSVADSLERLDDVRSVTTSSTFPLSVSASSFGLFPVWRLRRLVRAQKIDVVLNAMVHPFTPLGLTALKWLNVPVVSVIHDAEPHPGERLKVINWVTRYTVKHSTRLIAASDHVGSQLRHRGFTNVDVMALVDHHDMVDHFAADGDVVFVGRLLRYKGLRLLADAWAMLPTGHGVRLRVHGEDQGGVTKDLERLGEVGAEVSTGWIPYDEMPSVLQGARLLVLPYFESSQSGLARLALAARIPVLFTRVGGLSDQLRAGATGVEPNPKAFSKALRSLIDNPEDLKKLHAEACAAFEFEMTDGQAEQRQELLNALRKAVANR